MDIVRPAQLLDKGLPIPGLVGRFVVEEGWCAVITEGGMFREILPPGDHPLNRYSFWRDAKAYVVDTRIQTLKVLSKDEMAIQRPYPMKINLDLSVEYRVADPRRVALEVKTPLTALFDRVMQSVRAIVVNAGYEEIQTQGEGIASGTLQRLQAMQLRSILGIEVFNVLVNSISAMDVGDDSLAARQQQKFDVIEQQQAKEYMRMRDWQLESQIAQQSKVSWEWLLMHRPEIAQQLINTHGMLAKEMIDKGLLDPAGFLNQPTSMAGSLDPSRMLASLGMPGGLLTGSGAAPQSPMNTNPSRNPGQLPAPGDIHSRIREELNMLEKLPGAKIDTKAGTDARGVPDGSYDLRIVIPRTSAGNIVLYVTCLSGYPQAQPVIDVEIDNQPTPFQSAVLRRWTGQYLVEVVREVKQYFG
jgi:regulator of protease activity HflC (stomatin/prohibitin superfamily)